jgi:hypothetical protein
VSIDELVPDDHLLRLIDKYIDFTFLLEKVRPFYSEDNGRPSYPLILFKMMFIGYLLGIRSERQLIEARKSVLPFFRLICLPVDWSGGHSTPAGYRGHWRPRRRQSAEEAPGPPRGKRVPGAEINRPDSRDNQLIINR